MKDIKENKKFYTISTNVLSSIINEFGEDLICLILCGSAGRGKFIENWSDLDYCCIVNKININKIDNIFKNLSNSDIKIGISFFNKYDWEKGFVTRHAYKTILEIHDGFHFLVYQKGDIIIPTLSINGLLNCKQDFFIAYQNFKRNALKYDYRKLFKSMMLLKKYMLYFHNIIEDDYNLIDEMIYKIYKFDGGHSSRFIFEQNWQTLFNYANKFSNFLDKVQWEKHVI